MRKGGGDLAPSAARPGALATQRGGHVPAQRRQRVALPGTTSLSGGCGPVPL